MPAKPATDATVVGQPFYPLSQSNELATYRGQQQQQEPILYITPAPPTAITTTTATSAPTNEESIYETQQQEQQQQQYNRNDNNNNNAQVVTQNAINIQQQQRQQQQKEQEYTSTGRAVDYHAGYPFGQLITPLIKNAPVQPRPVYRKPVTSYSSYPSSSAVRVPARSAYAAKTAASSNVGKIIYPQAKYQQKPPSQAEIDKLRGKGKQVIAAGTVAT